MNCKSVIWRLNILKARIRSKMHSIKHHNICDDFSIISNNCWAAEIYKELNYKYKTPFVGLFMFAPCYITLLKDLRTNLLKPLVFVRNSKYAEANLTRHTNKYPIGTLSKNIEIHFLHYKSEDEARIKWNRRIKRINWDKLFVEFSQRDRFNKRILDEYDKLPFRKKICFTSEPFPSSKSAILIKECIGRSEVADGQILFYFSKMHFDIPTWLNS